MHHTSSLDLDLVLQQETKLLFRVWKERWTCSQWGRRFVSGCQAERLTGKKGKRSDEVELNELADYSKRMRPLA